MRWLGRRRESDVDRWDEPLVLDDAEIIELDGADPRSAPDAVPEVAYLRDRRDPTGTAGIWRALEGL